MSKYHLKQDIKLNIEFDDEEGEYTHITRLPTIQDLIEIDFECQGKTRVTGKVVKMMPSSNDPDVMLWNKIIKKVDGYGDIKTDSVPVFHKLQAVKLLTKTEILDRGEVEEHFGPKKTLKVKGFSHKVRYLKAFQAVANILTYHVFRQPTEDDHTKYKLIKAKSRLELDDKSIDVFNLSFPKEWAELYDSIIDSVQGYQPDDIALVPPDHKIITVMNLFASIDKSVDRHTKN